MMRAAVIVGVSAPTALAVRIAEAAALTLVGIARDVIFAFGTFYIRQLLRAGREGGLVPPPAAAVPNRSMSVVGEPHLASPADHLAKG